MSKLEFLRSEFQRIHGAPPERIVRAPGRVNLIGEHTDYNDGFVMPIAIDREVLIAARRRTDQRVHITALDVYGGQTDVFDLNDIAHHPDYRWANYVRGVAYYLSQYALPLVGMDAVVTSTLPSGAGLSSSAALEVCTATILQALGGFELDRVTVAKLCQRAEIDFVGVMTGIMDQYASALGESDKALEIDCRKLTYESVRLPRGVAVVVADTNKKRHLANSHYNTRRLECENAVTLLAHLLHKPFKALRDVSLKDLERAAAFLPENQKKRARHVITENARVKKAAQAAERNDAETFGTLMNESQSSLHNDYEASSPELDLMVELARKQKGCLGARLTGAGWGGATVNLVRQENVAAFMENVAREYQAKTGIEPWVAPVRASPGASLIQ
jgi:galactokinase